MRPRPVSNTIFRGVIIMDKRNTIRVPFHVRAVIKYRDVVIEGEVMDLSTGGMFFNTTRKIAVDETVSVSIFLYGSSSNLALMITGKVARATETGIAIKFTELDLDSFIHLRNIVSRNAFDEEKIIKEFEEFSLDDSSRD
jgi:DNA-directed RNA polymerase subunit E'/Rpb7